MAEHRNGDRGPEQGFERITLARVRPGAAPVDRPAQTPASKTLPAGAVWAALGVVVLAAVAVFFWLPARIVQPPAASPQEQPPAAAAHDAESQPPDADAVLRRRQQAQTLAEQAANKRARLQDKSVDRWAQAEFAAASRQFDQAREQFQARDFDAAAENYRSAITAFDRLLERAGDVLSQALARGQNALDAGDSKTADEAFALALAVDPGNAAAQRGKQRAASLDQVLALLRSGRAHEQAGELTAARDDFQKAHELDGQSEQATAALERVRSALAQRAYQRQMSAGLAALDRGEYAAARDAFNAAGKLRPGSEEAADGLAQARAGLERQAIAEHRERAHSLEQEERWQAAADEYKAALVLDKTLSFAQKGLQHATERAQLDQRLSYHIEHPQRLQSADVRASAKELLDRARAVPEPGDKLRDQIQRLAGLIERAATPVPVQLRSDNKTRVLVYHVGDLGQFESKRVKLPPGDYTAVGRREGYRDVRREFTVSAGQTNGPVVIRCEDKI